MTPRAADDVRHPVFARLYARASPGVERKGAAEHRAEMLAGIAGRVLELGAGNGLNFAHYPAAVAEVLAVEPEPYLRERATDAAAQAPVPITVVAGVADALPASHVAGSALSLLMLSGGPEFRAPFGWLPEALGVLGAGAVAAADRWAQRSG